MKKYIYLLFLSLSLIACEKEIVIDYHDAMPRDVVEGSITPRGTTVRISYTQSMNEAHKASDIDNAKVTITTDDGTVETIPYDDEGYYRSDFFGRPGITYQLDVYLGEHHFSSTSTMHQMPMVTSFRLVRRKMIAENYIFGDVRVQDIPNEENWYYLHVYRNNVGYRWAVMKDDTNPNKVLQHMFGFDREGSSDGVKEGDELYVSVRAIDKAAYDYLYSMEQMNNTGTNPIYNFTGGCLGYFTAYSSMGYGIIYHEEDVEDE